MTARGPHVLAADEQPEDVREEAKLFGSTTSEAADYFRPSDRAQANRDILPMSTGVPILPSQSAQIIGHTPITGCSQSRIYKISRFMISNAGTAFGAADWVVKDIKINDVSMLVQPGDLSGAVFASNSIDETAKYVRFTPVQIGIDVIVIEVTYTGRNASGCPFFGSMVGTVIDTAVTEKQESCHDYSAGTTSVTR
jgi:hypothetical protein